MQRRQKKKTKLPFHIRFASVENSIEERLVTHSARLKTASSLRCALFYFSDNRWCYHGDFMCELFVLVSVSISLRKIKGKSVLVVYIEVYFDKFSGYANNFLQLNVLDFSLDFVG